MSKKTPEQIAHEERCKRELEEQKEILAKVKEDSDRYDAAVKKGASSAEPQAPVEPEKGK